MAKLPESTTMGSSPRVRGAARYRYKRNQADGIIPARAGSRLRHPGVRGNIWDHPRACGEQSFVSKRFGFGTGSSPRVRGAAHSSNVGRIAFGIIPARAGSSENVRRADEDGRDHPRACGEQLTLFRLPLPLLGSSPRVRGADLKIPAQNTLSL